MPVSLYSCNHAYIAKRAGQPPRASSHFDGKRYSLREAGSDRGGLGRAYPDRAGEPGSEVGRHDLDVPARLRGLDHPAVAQVDRDVRDVAGRGRIGVVEEQVAGRELAHRHRGARPGPAAGAATEPLPAAGELTSETSGSRPAPLGRSP